MTIVLFHIATGSKIEEFECEEKARTSMREYNAIHGHTSIINHHWENGIEMESTRNGIAPYGITELERWNSKFNMATKLADTSLYDDDF